LKQRDDFINPELVFRNFDRYLIRKSIFDALNRFLGLFHGSMLDIGCGAMPYREYILSNSAVRNYVGLDIESAAVYDEKVRPDYSWDGKRMPFAASSFDCAIGTEVLEHCPEPEIVLKETWRVLKPGGVFFFTVPFLWNLHEVPHDHYRYTPFSLERHLKNSGFGKVEIHATGGWHASMAQMLGLYVKRAPIPAMVRRLLFFVVCPVYRILLLLIAKEKKDFTEGIMTTGLYGTAFKNSD